MNSWEYKCYHSEQVNFSTDIYICNSLSDFKRVKQFIISGHSCSVWSFFIQAHLANIMPHLYNTLFHLWNNIWSHRCTCITGTLICLTECSCSYLSDYSPISISATAFLFYSRLVILPSLHSGYLWQLLDTPWPSVVWAQL